MYARYYAEPDRYKKQVNMYNNIQNQNELLYDAGGSYYEHSNIGIINTVKAIKGLAIHDRNTVGGGIIKIYRVTGQILELDDINLKYLGDESPILNEDNNILKILIDTQGEVEKLYLNSNKYRVSYHIYDTDNNLVLYDGKRTFFGSFTGSAEIDMEVDVNAVPEKGTYILEVDIVQECVAWLSDLGMQTVRIEIEVQ